MNKQGVKSRHIRYGWKFRVNRVVEKPGLYFGSVWDYKSFKKLGVSEIIGLRDFLSLYINQNINKKPTGFLFAETRVHARAIIKNANKLEAK